MNFVTKVSYQSHYVRSIIWSAWSFNWSIVNENDIVVICQVNLFCLFKTLILSMFWLVNTEQITVDTDGATNRKLRSKKHEPDEMVRFHYLFFSFLVTDLMKRENAIAEDFWRELLKQNDEKTKWDLNRLRRLLSRFLLNKPFLFRSDG